MRELVTSETMSYSWTLRNRKLYLNKPILIHYLKVRYHILHQEDGFLLMFSKKEPKMVKNMLKLYFSGDLVGMTKACRGITTRGYYKLMKIENDTLINLRYWIKLK